MRQGRVRKLAIVTAMSVGLLGAVAGPAVAAAAPAGPGPAAVTQARQGSLASTVDGTFTDATGQPGTVSGTFTPTGFTQQGNQILATGNLVATLVDSAGKQFGTTTRTVTVPLQLPGQPGASGAAVCQVLHLVLGPLNLNLLGLVVHLNQIDLNITAVPGPGNLLGNLLCAIAGLLNGTGSLSTLTADLNGMLGLLSL